MPQRKYNTEREKVSHKNKRIILPISIEEYNEISVDGQRFRGWVDEMIEQYPALFPQQIEQGYQLHDILPASKKLPEVRLRRIKLKATDEAGQVLIFTIVPSNVLPYMVGLSDEVEKPLFLRRFGVPYWALSYVFGRDDDYWYRLEVRFGQYEIVATTIQEKSQMPDHLLADEKHVRFHGDKGYIATTVGQDCILGASLALGADEDSLTQAYGVFKQEAQTLDPDYAPQTVNNDGWLATQKAWQSLFHSVVIIECFLHAFLKIRDRCKRRFKPVYAQIQQQVWDIYHATDKQDFREQTAHFLTWAAVNLTDTALDAVQKLCAKSEAFLLAFDHPNAYRTSNMIDRHMIPLDRWLGSIRFFHGHWASAERLIRAWVLFHNFGTYCPRAKVAKDFSSPAHKLNGSLYHQNWLHNLLISSSSSGFPSLHRKY